VFRPLPDQPTGSPALAYRRTVKFRIPQMLSQDSTFDE